MQHNNDFQLYSPESKPLDSVRLPPLAAIGPAVMGRLPDKEKGWIIIEFYAAILCLFSTPGLGLPQLYKVALLPSSGLSNTAWSRPIPITSMPREELAHLYKELRPNSKSKPSNIRFELKVGTYQKL